MRDKAASAIEFAGLGFVLAGAFMASMWAGLIAVGVILVLLGLLLERWV